MALITCPDCGNQVSDKATACIHCGYPLNAEQPSEKSFLPIEESISNINALAQAHNELSLVNGRKYRFDNLLEQGKSDFENLQKLLKTSRDANIHERVASFFWNLSNKYPRTTTLFSVKKLFENVDFSIFSESAITTLAKKASSIMSTTDDKTCFYIVFSYPVYQLFKHGNTESNSLLASEYAKPSRAEPQKSWYECTLKLIAEKGWDTVDFSKLPAIKSRTSHKLTWSKIKKPLLIIVLFFCCGLIIFYYAREGLAQRNAAALATYGEEQFLTNDFPLLISELKKQGLDDLTTEADFSYEYYTDYNKNTRRLYLDCYLLLNSQKIDDYYTKEYRGTVAYSLWHLLDDIYTVLAANERFEYHTEKGSVIIRIDAAKYYPEDLEIHTSSGRLYSYYKSDSLVDVSIDGNILLMETIDAAFYDDSAPASDRAPAPYEGMLESQINSTALGHYTTREACKDFAVLEASHRSVKYRWYENGIQDLDHLQCIATVKYWDHKTDRIVDGYVSSVSLYD